MKSFVRFISLLLSLVMVISAISPFKVRAEESTAAVEAAIEEMNASDPDEAFIDETAANFGESAEDKDTADIVEAETEEIIDQPEENAEDLEEIPMELEEGIEEEASAEQAEPVKEETPAEQAESVKEETSGEQEKLTKEEVPAEPVKDENVPETEEPAKEETSAEPKMPEEQEKSPKPDEEQEREERLSSDGLSPKEYAEKKAAYLAKEGKAAKAATRSASGYIGNSYIKAYIYEDGYYNIGTTDNDCLLYNFPSGRTSETLIRINGNDYFFTNYCTSVTAGEKEATAVAEIDGVTVTQTLKVITNPNSSTPNVIQISYKCVNNSSESKTIGVRIMLDTMLGSNDGAPFKVNGNAVRSEVEFTGSSIPRYYQAFDNLNDPNLVATGYTYYTNEEKPDKVQFAEWPGIRGSSWDYQVTEGNMLTGDSAFVSYFNEKTVSSGKARLAVTYYGAYNAVGSGKFDTFDFDEENMDKDLAIFCAEMAAFAYQSIQGYWDYGSGSYSEGIPLDTASPTFFYDIDGAGESEVKNFNRSLGIYEYLKAYKFKNISHYNYANPSENSATYTLAWKKVNHNGRTRDMIIVAIRGTNKVEWKGNMNVTGTSYKSQAVHDSFQNGARMIESALMRYMNEHTSIQDPLVVIAGHSRGGAVGNLLAANLINGEVSRISAESVFAYLFAVPNCTTDFDTSMDHIYNFCFQDDFVPSMPLHQWDYYKHGTTYVQNAEKAMKTFSEFKTLEKRSLKKSNNREPSFSTAETKNVVQSTARKWKTVEKFYNLECDEIPPTLYEFMHDVVAPAAYGNLLNKSLMLPYKGISPFSTIADFFVDGFGIRKSINDTHQVYTYYNALKAGVFDQASLSPDIKMTKKTDNTGASAPKSIYSSTSLENSEKKAGTRTESLTASEQEQIALAGLAQTGTNLEKLGWDLQDCSTWSGITWTEDGRVSTIDVAYLGLEGALDLTAFSELTELDVAGNSLVSLTLPSPDATSLSWLVCRGNRLKSLDIEGQPLELLICDNNFLDEALITEQAADIEAVTISPQRVENAVYSENDITALRSILTNETIWDLSAAPEEWIGVQWELSGDTYHVVALDISGSGLSGALNVSGLSHLRKLDCQENEFESIDFSGCSELTFLNCVNNKLTSVNGNEALEYFYCDNNYLSSEEIQSVGAENTSSGNQNITLSSESIAEEEREVLNALAESIGADVSEPGQWQFVTWKEQDGTWYAERLDLSGQSGVSGNIDLSGFLYLTDVSFAGTSVESVILPNSITEIAAGAFFDCQKLTSVVMPNNIVRIGDRAFSECSSLEYILLSDTLSQVGSDAFVNDTSLISMFFTGNAPSFGEDVFVGTSIDFKIMYKEGTTGWDDETLAMGIPTEYEPLMIRSYPEKTEYFPGDELDLAGLELLYIDESTSVEVVTDSYQISETDMSTPGEKTVEVTYKGETASFEILVRRRNISTCGINLSQYDFTYTGSEICPEVTVAEGDMILTPDVDYTVSFGNNTACGNAYLIVSGIGNWENSQEVSFRIIDDRKIDVTDLSHFESDHNYNNYSSAVYTYECNMDGIEGMDLVFNENCYFESGYDYLRLLNEDGEEINSWTRGELAGCTVGVDGTKISLELDSDSSYTEWGFKVDKIIYRLAADLAAPLVSTYGKTVSLTWEKVPNAEGYRVYRSTEEGYWSLLDTVTGTEYIDEETEFSSVYVYRVAWLENGLEYISNAYGAGVETKTGEDIVITAHPADASVFAGDKVTFTVEATGTELAYQWYYRTINEGDGVAVSASSGKTAAYTLSTAAKHNGYQYRCKVTSQSRSVYSDWATLTVKTKLEITVQPKDVTVVGVGTKASVSVTAKGDGLTYTWYVSDPGDAKFTKSSVKKSTYTQALTAEKNGRKAYCIITDTYGNSVKTNTVTMDYVTGKPKITTQPKSAAVKKDAKAAFKVVAKEAKTYQWYYRTSSSAAWKAVTATGGKTASYSVVATSKRNGYQYRCKVVNPAGSVYSSTVTLTTVTAKPKITTQPTAKTVKAGKTVTFKVAASGRALSYQWYYRKGTSGAWTKVTAASGKTATLSMKATSKQNGYYYRCIVTNAMGNVTSKAVKLTVN